MGNFESLRIFNKLKSVYRFNSVDNRKESTAEHSWGCLMIADYFLSTTAYKLDRMKVYELLMYHDLVEIEIGDTPIKDKDKRDILIELEKKGVNTLKQKLPKPLNEKFTNLFEEFTFGSSKEAVFARAIDGLEAEIHELDYKKDWIGWTKEYLLSKKLHRFEQFPEIQEMFEEIVEYLDKNNYFDNSKV
jgi:putative hydrolase of HD superfamily